MYQDIQLLHHVKQINFKKTLNDFCILFVAFNKVLCLILDHYHELSFLSLKSRHEHGFSQGGGKFNFFGFRYEKSACNSRSYGMMNKDVTAGNDWTLVKIRLETAKKCEKLAGNS